ncbi:radial spoke head 1 homolog isoform X1 [Hydra vulgaris]|uniref:radial spoke head 1 homolog isoform X1 n=1 Tax=Hydra vulgaris TaxID=6087 RepID=UPI001F5FE9BB|nr:radial spoke head 1 homolog isoform X1 [Hydra vulgaris]
MSYKEEDEALEVYEGSRNNNGERHGFGKCYFTNGDIYEGQYEHGKRHGSGNYQFVSGAQYIGEYQNGKKHGCGTINNPDGSKYEGQWFNGQKNGSGTYHYVNGDIYEGEWSRDQRNGHGKYIYYDTGSIMEGFWMNGNLNGTGRIVHKSYRFCGVFVNGKQVGNGSYFFDNGLEQQGYFRKINKDQVENKCNQSELEWSPTKLIQLKKI